MYRANTGHFVLGAANERLNALGLERFGNVLQIGDRGRNCEVVSFEYAFIDVEYHAAQGGQNEPTGGTGHVPAWRIDRLTPPASAFIINIS